jgi:hypothetical protein
MGGGRQLSWGRTKEKAELVTGDGDNITVVLHGTGNQPRMALSSRSKTVATASSW